MAFVVSEPLRRWRATGTDLLTEFAGTGIDAFGIDGDQLPVVLGERCPQLSFAGNLAPAALVEALARRRAYLHLIRWTSLSLSLITAMMLGMPVIALGTTEAFRAVPEGSGVCTTDLDQLRAAADRVLVDRDLARSWGGRAREHALERFSLDRFVTAWSTCLADRAG